MNTTITRTGALTPDQRTAVEQLLERVAQHDGVRPLNEAAHFALAGKGHAVHWLAWCGTRLIGYGQADRDDHSVQLLVDPEHRRKGVGTALAEQVRTVERNPVWWAFGNMAGAQHLAEGLQARPVRELLVMERDLTKHPASEDPAPEGVVVRPFQPGDAQALVDVNEMAFAHHPEQGEMSLDEFQLRTTEGWFDPEGLLVASDDETGAFLGFHWTKIDHSDPNHPDEPIGEVYVIGVHPDASGRGIGRALLSAGLRHLQHKGVRRVRLYVEASSERVVRMYEQASFAEITRDASYASRGVSR